MPFIDFDLRQLEIFCKVVELKSFSKAAEAVFLAQASVSERIANLEKAIGTRLLDRLGRKIVPTRAGELLYKHAVLLLDMKKTARLEMENFLGLKRGEIYLGGSTIPGEYIIPKIIGQFYSKYPLVSVLLIIVDSKEIERLVLEGDLELGVIGSKSSNENIRHNDLWEDRLVLAVPANHKWAEKKAITLNELSEEPFIVREAGSGTMKITEGFLKSRGLKGFDGFNTIAHLGTSTAVKEAIKAELGVSILSSRAIETELNAGVLKTVSIKGLPAIKRSFYLIRDKRRIASPLCQALLEFLLTSGKES
jgi:DNA-binding transcriptional LysR family regulator